MYASHRGQPARSQTWKLGVAGWSSSCRTLKFRRVSCRTLKFRRVSVKDIFLIRVSTRTCVCVCVRSWTYTYLHMRTPCDSFYLNFSIFCFLSGFLCCLILAPFLFARSLFCLPGSPSCTLVDLLACSLACLLFAWRVCLPSYGSYRNMVLFPFYWLPSFLPSFPPSLPPLSFSSS